MPVEWVVPDRARAGERLDVRVVVTGEEGTKVDGVTLRLVGVASWSTNDTGRTAVLYDRAVDLLPPTQNRLRDREEWSASFDLPPTAGASCAIEDLRPVSVVWTLTLAVSKPWRFDLEEEREIVVEPAPAERPPPEAWRSLLQLRSGIRAEMVLDDHHLAPGETIPGRIALFDLRGRNIYELRVSSALVLSENVDMSERKFWRCLVENPCLTRTSGLEEGREIPFRLKIPEDALPAMRSDDFGFELYWAATVHLEDDQHSESVEVELDVRPFGARDEDAPDARGVALGKARWRKVLEEVAQANDLAMADDDLRATGTLAGIAATIELDATTMRAGLQWPSWGLDLRYGSEHHGGGRRVRDVDPTIAAVGEPWARDPEQARAFLSGVLAAALHAAPLVGLSDEGAAFVEVVHTGHSDDRLQAFTSTVKNVAAAAREARSRISPPTAMKDALPAWRAFAAARGGTLDVARMALVDVPWDGAALTIETTFDDDGDAAGTRATMRSAATLAGNVPEDARDSLGELAEIEVQPSAIVARARRVLDDPATHVGAFDALRALVDRLSVDARLGPYR